MDTSEQYIKMRLAAIPDLGMGTPPFKPCTPYTGSWCYSTGRDDIWVDLKGDWYYVAGNITVQLERQDQLQAMLEEKDTVSLIRDFEEWMSLPMWIQLKPSRRAKPLAEEFYANLNRLTSMEQLWLSFVQKEKYSKCWIEEEWKEML